MSTVIRHVVESIAPASRAQAEAARLRVAGANAPMLDRLAAALGGAQHTARIRSARRIVLVVAGDHGAGAPGVALGPTHPTVVAAHAIADGTAALAGVARHGRATIVLVDAGVAEPAAMPDIAVRLAGRPSRDLRREPAMTVVDATLGVEAGIALAVSLVDAGLDVLAVGALGIGAELSAVALLGAALGAPPSGTSDPDADAAGRRGAALAGASALERLSELGGPDTAVLAGVMLGAASMNVSVLLDGHATGAAALVAAAFAPAVTGSLIAAHAGAFVHPRILAHLGLSPIFEVGLGHGEGVGAAMVLPLVDQVVALGGT